MFAIARFATLAYVLTVFAGGYLAVSTLKGLWEEAERFDRLTTLALAGETELNHTLLVFDAIEPSAGGTAESVQ